MLLVDVEKSAEHVDEFEEFEVFNFDSRVITLRYTHLGPQVERVKEDDRFFSSHNIPIIKNNFDAIQDLFLFLDRLRASLFHELEQFEIRFLLSHVQIMSQLFFASELHFEHSLVQGLLF